jgi:hypothetical protein
MSSYRRYWAKARISIFALLLPFSLLAGCEAQRAHIEPARATETTEFSDWVSAGRHKFFVGASLQDSLPNLIAEESNVGSNMARNAGRGALEGASTDMGSCDGMGCGLVVILWAAFVVVGAVGGAVYGAVTAESTEIPYSLPQYETELVTVREAIEPPSIEAIFRKQIMQSIDARAGNINAAEIKNEENIDESQDAVVRVSIEHLMFVGDNAEDPKVAMRINALADTSFPYRGYRGTINEDFSYESKEHSLVDWGANDASLFRSELDSGLSDIATQISDKLFGQHEHLISWETLKPDNPSEPKKTYSVTPKEDEYSFDGKWILEVLEGPSWSSGDTQAVRLFGNRFAVKVSINGWRGTISGEIDHLGNLAGTGTLYWMGRTPALLNFEVKSSKGSFHTNVVATNHWGTPPSFTIHLTRE